MWTLGGLGTLLGSQRHRYDVDLIRRRRADTTYAAFDFPTG